MAAHPEIACTVRNALAAFARAIEQGKREEEQER
jgi:hypothetical protein